MDLFIKSQQETLNLVFQVYSGKKALPSQKPFISLEEWRLMSSDLELDLPNRDIDLAYVRSMMTVIDEQN